MATQFPGKAMPFGTAGLKGRDCELAALEELVNDLRAGRSRALVLSGEAGIGKTALLDLIAARAAEKVEVERVVASESEMELAYAGLQQLCGRMMGSVDHLPAPQREALEAAFGIREAVALSPFLVGLAVLGLFNDHAGDRPWLCIVDDAQWLDDASAHALAFVARRLDAEGIAIVLAMRAVGDYFADLPQLAVDGLGDNDARDLLRLAAPGHIDERVTDQIIAEAQGNPLALRELPRGLSPAEIAGGFALTGSMPLEHRIERSVIAQLDPLPADARLVLLLAAADPTGDPGLLRSASAALGLDLKALDAAEAADALRVDTRVRFRHPLVRSAVYRAASADDRRAAHAALADATSVERDPDRRAWHRASATPSPDEDVAGDLERGAERARTRGGVAAVGALLQLAAELTPDPARRADRLIAAAGAKYDAGAPETALRLLGATRDHPLDAMQQALVGRMRARCDFALRRDLRTQRSLIAAARALAPLAPELALDTYMEALETVLHSARLGDRNVVAELAGAILESTAEDGSERWRDSILRGEALMIAQGHEAALPTLRRALDTLIAQNLNPSELAWGWLGCLIANDLWDLNLLRALLERQLTLMRVGGFLALLPMSLNLLTGVQLLDGRSDAAEATCDEIDAILDVTGSPVPNYGRLLVLACRGHADEVERLAAELTADAEARGEGAAFGVANFAKAVAFNGVGRYGDAVIAARQELPHAHELGVPMRALPELVEAATRAGERALAEEALDRLESLTRPAGGDYALGTLALAAAQLREGDDAEALYLEAIERFERGPVPLMAARARLIFGEMLRRDQRAVDARLELRAAHEALSRFGMDGFAERAARELRATGERVRARRPETADNLTEQELNVARLARDGLTNRDIGARLFISARTVEYHLHKVFGKLGIAARAELKAALPVVDIHNLSPPDG